MSNQNTPPGYPNRPFNAPAPRPYQPYQPRYPYPPRPAGGFQPQFRYGMQAPPAPAPTAPTAEVPSNKKNRDEKCFSVGKWFLTFIWICLIIPPIFWLFGGSKYQTRVNFVRARFVQWLVIIVILVAAGLLVYFLTGLKDFDFAGMWEQIKNAFSGISFS